jgi:adenine-specific DNA methylase
VLINKAMIEIPPKFAGRAPISPLTEGEKLLQATLEADLQEIVMTSGRAMVANCGCSVILS